MRVFVAGATGVIGRPLVLQLIADGHHVTAMTRRPDRGDPLRAVGAMPVVCDVYDVAGLTRALEEARADVVVNELTSLPASIHPRRIHTQLAANDRIRTEGTENLVHAALSAGVGRIVAQSIAFAYTPVGSAVKDESAPLWTDAPAPWSRSVHAIEELERQVGNARGIDGIVLRYGNFYGPGTAYGRDGAIAAMVRKRQFPIAGRGSGVFSFVHVDDATLATSLAVTRGAAGIYNVVDDEPALVRDWLPEYAAAIGAPQPWTLPAALVRLMAGPHGVHVMTGQRGASNTKARKELGWVPRYPSWRTGFHTGL